MDGIWDGPASFFFRPTDRQTPNNLSVFAQRTISQNTNQYYCIASGDFQYMSRIMITSFALRLTIPHWSPNTTTCTTGRWQIRYVPCSTQYRSIDRSPQTASSFPPSRYRIVPVSVRCLSRGKISKKHSKKFPTAPPAMVSGDVCM